MFPPLSLFLLSKNAEFLNMPWTLKWAVLALMYRPMTLTFRKSSAASISSITYSGFGLHYNRMISWESQSPLGGIELSRFSLTRSERLRTGPPMKHCNFLCYKGSTKNVVFLQYWEIFFELLLEATIEEHLSIKFGLYQNKNSLFLQFLGVTQVNKEISDLSFMNEWRPRWRLNKQRKVCFKVTLSQ